MYKVSILSIEPITHDVKKFVLEKPVVYKFIPGQATEVAITKTGWEGKKHPFTFTSLNEEKNLEFIIKGYPVSQYPNHTGVTEAIHKLSVGDDLLIDEPWGTISYKGSGVFIAGGAGITPFIAILRQLAKDRKLKGNKLVFSNKEARDVIVEKELRQMFGKNLILTLTREEKNGYESGRVNENFLKKHIGDFSKDFYICGPKQMVEDLKVILTDLGAKQESIVFEK